MQPPHSSTLTLLRPSKMATVSGHLFLETMQASHQAGHPKEDTVPKAHLGVVKTHAASRSAPRISTIRPSGSRNTGKHATIKVSMNISIRFQTSFYTRYPTPETSL